MTGSSTAVPTAGPVPDGTIGDVLAWVGTDPATQADRAQQAYDVEEAKTSPRSTLLTQLVALGAEPDTSTDSDTAGGGV